MSVDMGCGSSKRTAVVPVGDSVGHDGETGGGLTRRTSEVHALEGEDPPVEHLKEESVRPSLKTGYRETIGLYLGNLCGDSDS